MLKRVVVGLGLLFSLLVILFYTPPVVFTAMVLLLMGISAWEWGVLSGLSSMASRLCYVVLVCVSILVLTHIVQNYHLVFLLLLLSSIILWLWSMVAVVTYAHGLTSLGLRYALPQRLLGIVFLVGCGLDMWFLRRQVVPYGVLWIILPFFIVIAVDTGAYFTGSWCGRHTLAKRVSPKKTWEGVWGGIVVALIVVVVASYLFDFRPEARYQLWVLGLMTAVFSVFGDLLESLLKREASVKDSGALIPGHGGVLDRVDGLLAGIPIFTLGYVQIFFLTAGVH